MKKKIVYVCMSADILHAGHINILERASRLGNVVVGLMTDQAISYYKKIPFLNYYQREIVIRNLNSKKRPISAVADNIEVRNAKNITIHTNQKIRFNLLYDQNRSLQKKIKLEQLRRETS